MAGVDVVEEEAEKEEEEEAEKEEEEEAVEEGVHLRGTV